MKQLPSLYFIPSCGEFLKIQPGTGDNLLPEDIDGELPMECIDSGMVMLKEDEADVLNRVLEFAYGSPVPDSIFLQK